CGWITADLGQLRGPIERDPAHQLRRDVVLRFAPRLPDPLVGLAPDLRRALGLGLYERPEAPRQPLAAACVQQNRVECGTEDIVLPLIEGAVADAHRPCSCVAGHLVARGL